MRRKNFKRGKRPTFIPKIDMDVDGWLASNPDHLISCPNQPGHLRLSRRPAPNVTSPLISRAGPMWGPSRFRFL